MTLCRLIAPDWVLMTFPGLPKVLEGLFTDEQLKAKNSQYNVYYLPNYPAEYAPERTLSGTDIDTFEWVFIDMDLKEGTYATKDAFLEEVVNFSLPPNKIVDSGNGVHVYWRVSDLDAKSYLRFQRRLCRHFKTDEAVSKIMQLMRLPNTLNIKKQDEQPLAQVLYADEASYTSEQLDSVLPTITREDEDYCQTHYNRTYNIEQETHRISEKMPAKWGKLLHENLEVKALWSGNSNDRSKNDYRLGHIMFANGFTKEEAITVLANSAKASQRAPIHRINYAVNIVDKIWTYETEDKSIISPTVRDILAKGEETIKGIRFPCSRILDDTYHGFRLGQVLGIIAGAGVGKTTLTLNTFLWFAANNPDYHHFFFSLEQPVGELAARVAVICGGNTALYDKIHIISNFDADNNFINFSMETIAEHIDQFQKASGAKVGAVVVDHIGVLDKQTKHGENEGLIGVCKSMKMIAMKLNIFLIMLSQAPREKAGIGDLELDKNAAYGTVFFESFVDYLLCLWQPLKRMYAQGAPTVMAFKYAKIRHKKQHLDRIKEDVCYQLFFDPETERLRELTQDEETGAKYWLSQATNARKLDKKTDLISYQSRRVEEQVTIDVTPTRATNHH